MQALKYSLSLAICAVLGALGSSAADSGSDKPIKLLTKIGKWHHPVTTTNAMAQHFFNQGLSLVYGFNHDAAIRSFKRALTFDRNLAMAHWGIGYALGPNINLDVDPEREAAAFKEAQLAVSLAGGSAADERAYIFALTNRYSLDPKADLRALQIAFKNAMGQVARQFPDDLDAATIYAESMMNLHPWALWSADGKPAEDTEEIVAVLESVLRRNPNHPGANHYYIHAVEASPTPERALPSAQRLESLVPAAGHLVHMPAHIYMRVGDFAAAARRNEVAASADRDYIQACGIKGVYPLLYYSHNLHFLSVAQALQGRFADARKAADKLAANVSPSVKDIPELEGFLPTHIFVLAMFQRWDDLLNLPPPDPSLKQVSSLQHFGRGLAYAATGKLSEAESERSRLLAIKQDIPEDAKFGALNKVHDVLKVADLHLAGTIARARGDNRAAIGLLEQAVAAEDRLRYAEPPDWYLYNREALAGALMAAKDYAKAEEVCREDLRRNPRKGRALYGLQASLQAQGKDRAANLIKRDFETAWKNADTKLPPLATW
jgi:tetratricopeptide (TPR) repeat protein